MIRNKFKWFCPNCGKEIYFDCVSRKESFSDTYNLKVDCSFCGQNFYVNCIGNTISHVDMTVLNPINFEVEK